MLFVIKQKIYIFILSWFEYTSCYLHELADMTISDVSL